MSKSVPRPPPPLERALSVGATGTISSSLLSPLRAPCPVPPLGSPALIVGAMSSPGSRRGGESPRKPSRSRRTGGRSSQFPASRTANTRRRRCATPNHCASSTHHSTSPASPSAMPSVPQPSAGTSRRHPAIEPATTAKSRPRLLLNAPGTFSQMSHRAPQKCRAALKILICSWKRPERSPARPLRFPATDRSWHGDPPTTTSIRPSAAMRSSVMSVTLPRFGT